MRGRLAAVAFALIGWAAAAACGGHGGGGFHSGGGGGGGFHSSGGSHSSGGGGGEGGGRAWIGAKPPSSFKPSFAETGEARGGGRSSPSSTIGFERGSPTVASGGASVPLRPWPGLRGAQPAAADSTSNPAAVFFKALGELALYNLLDADNFEDEADLEPVQDRSDATIDPCQECPLDAPCGACPGYGDYACRDNPARVLDRCVSTAPRNVEPAAY